MTPGPFTMNDYRVKYVRLLCQVWNNNDLTPAGKREIRETLATHLGCLTICPRLAYVVAKLIGAPVENVSKMEPGKVVALAVEACHDATVRHALQIQAAVVDAHFHQLIKW